MGTQPIYTARFRHSLDHIGPLLVIPESVDDDCASVGKDSLYLKRPTHGVDIIPQGAEIHIRPLLDTRDRTLRYVQHFGHIGLRELPGAAKFFQCHSLKLVAHHLPVIRDGRGIHFRLKLPVVTCHTITLRPPTLAGAGRRWHRRAVHTPHTSDCCPFYHRQSVAWQPGARRTHREPDTAAPHAECATPACARGATSRPLTNEASSGSDQPAVEVRR